MNRGNKSKVIQSITRMYFYACASLLASFFLPLFLGPLKVIGSLILNAIVVLELSPLLSSLAYGFVVATLSILAWNFFVGAGLQILAGLFGTEAPQIVLIGRAAIIGFIYGSTHESIARTLKYDIVNLTILVIVLLTEFLAYSIATHGGVKVGKSVGKLDNGTRSQRIVNFLIGPLPFTYRRVKHELKRQMKSAVKLCPIIAAILLFSAMLEIWLVVG